MKEIFINPIQAIDVDSIIRDEKIYVIDNFYENLDWLNEPDIFRKTAVNENESIYHLTPQLRYPLMEKITKIIPKGYFPTDTGWIRSTSDSPMRADASYLHADHPYLVLSICLSSPEIQEDEEKYGTIFLKHKDFGFKKIQEHHQSNTFKQIFQAHRDTDEMWVPWFQDTFKKNRAIIYDGSLLHKMPSISFGKQFSDNRLIQIFNFRM